MTGSDRERDVAALAAFLRTIPSKRETETFGQYDRRRARAVLASDWLAGHVRASAAKALRETLDQRNEALARLSDRTRAKWEAEGRYAALVDKVRALANEWDGYGHGRYNVHLEERLPCPACDLLADLRALLEAVR